MANIANIRIMGFAFLLGGLGMVFYALQYKQLLVSYVGIAALVLGLILSMAPFFMSLSHSPSSKAPSVLD